MMSLLGRGEEVRSFLPSYPFGKVTSLTKYDKSLSLFVSQTLFVGKKSDFAIVINKILGRVRGFYPVVYIKFYGLIQNVFAIIFLHL